MSAKIIDGRAISQQIYESLIPKIKELTEKLGRMPCLVGLECQLVPEIEAYINSQKRIARRLGIEYKHRQVAPYEESMQEAIEMVSRDDSIDGVLIHTPLPEGVDLFDILPYLSPEKDVEGISPGNTFAIFWHRGQIIPTTPKAVLRILDEIDYDLYGKEIAMIGQGVVVGRPLTILLAQKRATVRLCHLPTYKTGKLRDHLAQSDVVIAAVGSPEVLKGEWIKPGAVVIDVGINEVDGKLVGDVEFDVAKERASMITPVPGGVGPVTVAMLIENLVILIERKLDASDADN